MAGSLGIAVALRIEKLVCPHCAKVQARAKAPKVDYRVCTRCHRRFPARTARSPIPRHRR